MIITRLRKTITLDRFVKALQINRPFILLDLALLATAILLAITEARIFFFHVIFVLLTFGAFYWQFRAFVWRAALWVAVTSAVLVVTVLIGEIPAEEILEIPLMVAILLLVFFIARYRAKAEAGMRQALGETQQRQQEVSALLESSRAVLAHGNFEDAARSIFDSCKHLSGARTGYMALLSENGPGGESLYLDPDEEARPLDPTLSMPIVGLGEMAIRTGRTVFENDFPHSQWHRQLPAEHRDIENVLFAPLVIDGNSVGLLGLANKPAGFTENDAQLASAFSELATIALVNSRATESLQNSEARFRSVAQTAGEAIITIDSQGKIVFWNKAATTMFGYSEDEAVGKPLAIILPDRFRLAHQKGLERVISSGQSPILGQTIEMVGLRCGADEFPVELSLSSWQIKKEIFFTGVIRDITDRKQAEAAEKRHKETLRQANEELEQRVLERTAELRWVNAELVREVTRHKQTAEILRESEERYRRLVELGFQAVAIHSQGSFLYVNPPAIEMVGATGPEELVGKTLHEFVHPDDWELVQERLRQMQDVGKGMPQVEIRLIRVDGTSVDVELMSVPISYQGQAAVQSVIRDISARKQAELERVKERERIARDLHDSLGHSLAYLHLKLNELSEAAGLGQIEKVQQNIGQMCEVANQAYEVVRNMLAASLPSNSTNLATALLVQARAAGKRANFKVQLTSTGQSRPLPPIVQQQLLYILQEALANVEKHAHARQVELNLTWTEAVLTVTLSDDGRGFPAEIPNLEGHFGLAIMQERARGINGQLTLSPGPVGGTQLILRLSLASVESITHLP